jgi:hypothetical protein
MKTGRKSHFAKQNGQVIFEQILRDRMARRAPDVADLVIQTGVV